MLSAYMSGGGGSSIHTRSRVADARASRSCSLVTNRIRDPLRKLIAPCLNPRTGWNVQSSAAHQRGSSPAPSSAPPQTAGSCGTPPAPLWVGAAHRGRGGHPGTCTQSHTLRSSSCLTDWAHEAAGTVRGLARTQRVVVLVCTLRAVTIGPCEVQQRQSLACLYALELLQFLGTQIAR